MPKHSEETVNGGMKIKLLKIVEILNAETDQDHKMSAKELVDRLKKLGISSERRSVAKDFQVLQAFDYPVDRELKGREYYYWMYGREFDLMELKMFADQLQADSYIPADYTQNLIDKLGTLCSVHEAKQLRRNMVLFNTRKNKNGFTYSSVDKLEQAIQEHRKASFLYFSRNENREKVYHHEGNRNIVDPRALVYQDGNYYLMTCDPKTGRARNYRLNRMDDVQIETETVPEGNMLWDTDIGKYSEQTFHMFTGDEMEVTLCLHGDRAMDIIYDKFGDGVEINRVDENTCETQVKVQVSPQFWGWLFGVRKLVTLEGPAELKQQLKEEAEEFVSSLS